MLDRKEETLPRTIQKILNECERDKLTDICKEQSLAEKNAEIISCTDPDSSVITSPQDDKMEDIEVKFEFALDNYVVEEIIPMEDNQFGKTPVSNYPLYSCNECKYTTKHIVQFKQHLKIHLKLNYSCDECDFKGWNGKSISKHKMQHCNRDKKRTICIDATVHSCDECNYTTKTKGNFNMHLRTHLNLTYFCEQCEFKGKNEKSFKLHQLQHFEGKISCDECDYKGVTKAVVKNHKLTRHRGFRRTCDICEYTSISSISTREHKRGVHQGIRNNCDKCDYSTISSKALEKHIEVKHLGIRISCEFCEFLSSTKTSMNRHKATKHQDLA